MMRRALEYKLEVFKDHMKKIPDIGIGKFVKIQSALIILNALERIITEQNSNPYPVLQEVIDTQVPFLKCVAALRADLSTSKAIDLEKGGADARYIKLFESAWTSYSDATYEHSVGLIRERLAKNGFGHDFFKGKRCFDGGCGTGRFVVAMAELGAKEVVGVDLGEKSLEYAEDALKRYGIKNAVLIKSDVTDLRQWQDGEFDFVVSNGVLHHTESPEKGLAEHFRVTKSGGVFWLYLYGEGGIYWYTYDQIKDALSNIDFLETREILCRFSLREGLIYTFLDNCFAPRRYFCVDDVVKMLSTIGEFSFTNLCGNSEIDDTDLLLKTKYGREIYGPSGEVRIKILKH